MMEFFQNLNIQDIWVALIGFISVNGMTIIGLIVAWAKGKIKHGMDLESVRAEARAEEKLVTNACLNALEKVQTQIKDMEVRINEALHIASEKEKEEIEKQSFKLSEAITAVKSKTIKLTDELNKL